ncbi:MAG: magnesium/cobalt transporter CorA [Crocinitomicaceae bacterium]|nr:magnesium/cobalt transporter CorA [Crocinitomicaceae bacterium]
MNQSFGHIYHFNTDEISKKKFISSEFVSDFSFSDLPEDKITWINFYIMDDFNPIKDFCKKAKYDALVYQNIYDHDNRPQFEDYGEYLFFSIKSTIPSSIKANQLFKDELSFVLGRNYIISFQAKPSDNFGVIRNRIENKKGIIREKSADFLLYKLLDAIIDNYYTVLDYNTTILEELDELITKNSDPKILSRIEIQKRKLIELRRISLPLKEITTTIESNRSSLFSNHTKHYFSDLKQSCTNIIEEIESNKNALDGLTNLYYAVQGQRMNEIMKMLTIVSTIFIPLTFIAGVYGMNFHYMPELNIKYGYFITLGVMVIIAVALLFYFRKKGWLKRE